MQSDLSITRPIVDGCTHDGPCTDRCEPRPESEFKPCPEIDRCYKCAIRERDELRAEVLVLRAAIDRACGLLMTYAVWRENPDVVKRTGNLSRGHES